MIGINVGDLLNNETYDVERNTHYPSWNVNIDKQLMMCGSDATLNEKSNRMVIKDSARIMIPIVGSTELNSQMHLAFRKALKEGEIGFLIDSVDKQSELEEKDPYFQTYSSDKKAQLLLPYLETRFLINEAISLETKFLDSGYVKLVEASTATKDRYIACAYANLLANKIILKEKKQGVTTDINIDEWGFLGGNYENVNNNIFGGYTW